MIVIKDVLVGKVISACISLAIMGEAEAGSRNCTRDERDQANARLMEIHGSPELQKNIVSRHLPYGVHVNGHSASDGPQNETLLHHEGYVLLHDGDLRTGLWASYELMGNEVDAGNGLDRVNCFRKDPRISSDFAARPSDYDEPIYDQGHIVNDRDLKDDLIEQVNTYVMSNMSAQHCRFNRGIWLSLEGLGRVWARKYEKVHVTSGAIFDFNARDRRDKDEKAARMGSRNQKARVGIPSHFYKVFLRQSEGETHAIAFLLENHNGPSGASWSSVKPKLMGTIVDLTTIEKRAEIELHPELDRTALTQSAAGEGWSFEEGISNLENGCPK